MSKLHFRWKFPFKFTESIGQYIPVKVENPEVEKAFLLVPEGIHRLDPFWIPSVAQDIASVFGSTKNPYSSHEQPEHSIQLPERFL